MPVDHMRYVYRKTLTKRDIATVMTCRDKHLRVFTLYVDPISEHVTLHMADGNRHRLPYHWIVQEDGRAERQIHYGSIAAAGYQIKFGPAEIEVRKLLARMYEP